MTTQYTSILKLALPVQGELSGSWGDVVNNNITSMVEQAVAGRAVIDTWSTNAHTLTSANGTTSESRCAMLEFTDSGTALSGAGTVICPTLTKIYIAKNAAGQNVTLKTSGGTGILVPNGRTMFLFCDGTNVVEALTSTTSLQLGTSTVVTAVLDEDNLGSNSATSLATQQSIKAYVDSQVGAADTLAEVLALGNTTGGTNIVVSTNDELVLPDGAEGAPSLTNTGDTNTGLYFGGADTVSVTTGGTKRLDVNSAGISVVGTASGTALAATGTSAVQVSVGTTAQRPANGAGQFRYNSTLGKFEGYTDEWGEIGGGAAELLLNQFTGNGSTTAFTMSSSPIEASTMVYIDGVYQNKTAYSISNDVITFSAAPATSAAIEVTAFTVAPVVAPTTFSLSQFTGNGSTTAFTLSSQSIENNTDAYFDGVYQSKSNYTVSGTTITFSTAPANGVAVEVMASQAVSVTIGTPDNNTVTTAKIVNDAVTTAKIADDAVTAAKIADDAVVAAAIADGAVLAAAIASNPITVGITTVVTSSNITATVNTHVYVATAARTITLPASPTIGQRVLVTVGNFTDTVIGRNGSNIMSSASNLTMDAAYLSIQFIYTNSTVGWAIA